jgi:hypothetical protein
MLRDRQWWRRARQPSVRQDVRVATELRLFADYFQIHVFDEGSETDFGDLWTGQAVGDGLAVGPDAVAIGTAVNVFVRVSVETLMSPPASDEADFDHVVEASLAGESGRLVVMGCTDYEPDAARFGVPPGWLRLRASRSNLGTAAALDIDSAKAPETMERVRIQVWPAAPADATVVKRWNAAQDAAAP